MAQEMAASLVTEHNEVIAAEMEVIAAEMEATVPWMVHVTAHNVHMCLTNGVPLWIVAVGSFNKPVADEMRAHVTAAPATTVMASIIPDLQSLHASVADFLVCNILLWAASLRGNRAMVETKLDELAKAGKKGSSVFH
jgi:hypothetical protein